MTLNHSLLGFFLNAGPVVKIVMLILLIASIMSWTFIFQRWCFLRKVSQQMRQFEKKFAEADNLVTVYEEVNKKNDIGLTKMFVVGFKDYATLQNKPHFSREAILQSVRSAMVVQQNRFAELLDTHLSFLATVASTSPYIGLFGTVWGIMTAFTALGAVQQATIAMVAPGISEALIATAMGLFAAIPAAIAYNRFTHRVDSILNHMEIFTEDFLRIISQQEPRS